MDSTSKKPEHSLIEAAEKLGAGLLAATAVGKLMDTFGAVSLTKGFEQLLGGAGDRSLYLAETLTQKGPSLPKPFGG